MTDRRIVFAIVIGVGFMILIALAMSIDISRQSQRIVDGSLGALGVAFGIAVQGIFRTDHADETRANNTGKGLDLAREALAAQPPGQPSGKPGDPLHTVEEAPQ